MREDKVTILFKKLTARKISIISRLSGLNQEEIAMMKLKWLDNLTDKEICDQLGMSAATLYRKRLEAHQKVLSALDLYGLKDADDLPAETILDYNGHFYEAQDLLVKFFVRHSNDSDIQVWMVNCISQLVNETSMKESEGMMNNSMDD